MYCSTNTHVCDIMLTIDQLKLMFMFHLPFLLGGDFNLNLFNSNTDACINFINNMYSYIGLYPIISLLTIVTNSVTVLR